MYETTLYIGMMREIIEIMTNHTLFALQFLLVHLNDLLQHSRLFQDQHSHIDVQEYFLIRCNDAKESLDT